MAFASDVFDTGPIMHVTSSASLRFVSISLTSGEQVDSLRARKSAVFVEAAFDRRTDYSTEITDS